MNRGRMLLVGALCVAAGAAVGAVVATRTTLGNPRYVPVYHVLVSADGMTLATTDASCGGGPVWVSETATTVTLRRPDSRAHVQGVCAVESYTVRLKAPLGNRTLIDAATGRTVPIFDGARILRPAHLPAGFSHVYDTANFDEADEQPAGPGCVQVYVKDGEYDDTLLIAQTVGGAPDVPDGVRPTRVTVHGHPGTAFPGEVEWTEDGQLITITSMTYAYAVLPTSELVAVGDSLG